MLCNTIFKQKIVCFSHYLRFKPFQRPFTEPFLPFGGHIEARTLFHPFLGFHHSVAVQVRAQVPVAYDFADRVICSEHPHQYAQGTLLQVGTGISRHSLRIQTPFVADPDTCSVILI